LPQPLIEDGGKDGLAGAGQAGKGDADRLRVRFHANTFLS
jgi:hypothetical protein